MIKQKWKGSTTHLRKLKSVKMETNNTWGDGRLRTNEKMFLEIENMSPTCECHSKIS